MRGKMTKVHTGTTSSAHYSTASPAQRYPGYAYAPAACWHALENEAFGAFGFLYCRRYPQLVQLILHA